MLNTTKKTLFFVLIALALLLGSTSRREVSHAAFINCNTSDSIQFNLSSSTVRQGETITLSSGHTSNSEGDLYIILDPRAPGGHVQIGTFTINSDGTGSGTATIPTRVSGESHTISITDSTDPNLAQNCSQPQNITIEGAPSPIPGTNCNNPGDSCTPSQPLQKPLCNRENSHCSLSGVVVSGPGGNLIGESCRATFDPIASRFNYTCSHGVASSQTPLCFCADENDPVYNPRPPALASVGSDIICDTETGGINTAIGCIPFGNINVLVGFFLRWALGIAGGIALILIIISAFQIATSAGDPKKLQAGRELFFAAITGILFLVFSVFILRFIGVNVLGIF